MKEMGLLLRRWEQAKEGLGQVVLLSGEAGIGKSSLVEGLRSHVRQEGLTRLTFRCSPYHTNSTLHPIVESLQRSLEWQSEDSEGERLTKLEQALNATDLPLDEAVPLMASLLSLPLPEDRYPALTLSPQQQRQYTQDTLAAWLQAEAERQAVLAVWEDLHWADPSTLEVLGIVLEQAPTSPMLYVLTHRPEFDLPWPTRSHMTPISLNRLEHCQVETLIDWLAGGRTLPTEVIDHIVAKTDGVPLYVEELTKMLLESEHLRDEADQYVLSGELSTVAIPDTLQDSLMARLDQLTTAKEVAQLGAVLGRQFSYDMIQAISPQADETLQSGLAQLVQVELLYQRGRPPRAKYTFKHALVQDAAYQSLLRRTRQQIHQQVAQLLETSFPEVVEAQPEVVAHHYSEGRQIEKAIGYWQKAGRRAIQRSANQEAIHHLQNGLELIATLPNRTEHAEQELDIQITLGPALIAIKGDGSPEVELAYARARELCQHVGETPKLFPMMHGLWRFYNTKAAYRTAKELGERLIALTRDDPNPARVSQAHQGLGFTLLYLGELTSARAHLDQAVTMSDRTVEDASTLQSILAPGVVERNVLAQALWSLGYPDQSLERSLEARSKAQEADHLESLAGALFFACRIYNLRRETSKLLEQSQALVSLATDYGFAQWRGTAVFMQGVALVSQGHGETGLEQMRQGMRDVLATGADIFRIPFLIMLSAACCKIGEVEEGLALLAKSMAAMEESGRSDEKAEAFRLQGELILRQHDPALSKAEDAFQAAVEIARVQEAKSWELRATISLARLWQSQGKRRDAYDLLAPVYEWFTEGFDTADLQDGKALLTEVTA